MSKSEYRHRTHINQVLAGSQASHGARSILQAMCHFAEFDRPEVTITKPQLGEHCRLCRKTIQRGLQFLKDECSIKPIRNVVGGRGNAVTYSLHSIGQGAKATKPAAPEQSRGGIWADITAQYEAVEPALFKAWLAAADFAGREGPELRILAQTQFAASHCQTHLADNVLQIARGLDPTIDRVKFIGP